MEKLIISHYLDDTIYSEEYLNKVREDLKKGKYDDSLDEAEAFIRVGYAEGGVFETLSSGGAKIKIEKGGKTSFRSFTRAKFYIVRITRDGLEFPFCYKFAGDVEKNLEYLELFKNAPPKAKEIIATEEDFKLDPGPSFEQRNFYGFAKNYLDAVLGECDARVSRSEEEIPSSSNDLSHVRFIIKDYKKRTSYVCPPMTPVTICVTDPRASNAVKVVKLGNITTRELRWRDQHLKDKRHFYGPIPSDMVFKWFYLYAEDVEDALIKRDKKRVLEAYITPSIAIDEVLRHLNIYGLQNPPEKYYDLNGSPRLPWHWKMSDSLPDRREDIQAHVGFMRCILKRRDQYVKKIKKIRNLRELWTEFRGHKSVDYSPGDAVELTKRGRMMRIAGAEECLHDARQTQLDVGYQQTDNEKVLHGLADMESLNIMKIKAFKPDLEIIKYWYQRIHNKTLDEFANQAD